MTLQSDFGDSTAIGRKLPATSLSKTAVTVRWLVGVIGIVLIASLLALNPPETTRYFVLFAVAMVVAELLLTVRVGAGSYFSVSSTFLFVYFLLAGGVAAAALDATSKFLVWLAQVFRKKNAPTSLFALYSVGQAVISSLAAAGITRLFERGELSGPTTSRPISTLVIFAVAYIIVNATMTSLVVASRGMSEIRFMLTPSTGVWPVISLLTSVPFAVILALTAGALGYTRAALLVLLLLAGIAFALRLNVQLRHGNEELKALNRIGSLVSATLDLNQLFRIVARESRRVLPWDGFFIAMVEKDSSEVQLIFMTGGGDEITQRTIPRGTGLTGRALATGETILYERGDKEVSEDDNPIRSTRKARSIAVAPMKFNEEIIGAISVQSFQSDVYGASEIRLLQTIAAQAAIAIRNAQLFTSEQNAKNERDEFLSLVTHEIKNPLTSIRGYADVGEKAIGSGDHELIREALGVIRGETKRILRLAEDLLDASKATAGKFSIQRERIDFGTIVRQVVGRFETTTGRPFTYQEENAIPQIDGDPIRLGQVVENLVSNAVKYSPRESAVTISLQRRGPLVRLMVADSGIGVAAEKVPLIFERFYRVVEDGHVVKGTGLGLFITREIVRMHGGDITVQSELEKGSTFTVELPVPMA